MEWLYSLINGNPRIGLGRNWLQISKHGVVTLGGSAKRILRLRPHVDAVAQVAHSKPTQVTLGAFKGYSFPVYAADNEEIFIKHIIPGRWDGKSDITFFIFCALSNSEDAGDNFNFQCSWNHFHNNGSTIPTTTHDTTTEQAVLAGKTAQYSTYALSFTLDYDINSSAVLAGDALAVRLRRLDATNPDVTNEIIVLDWCLLYTVDKMFSVPI